jgi:hypothetical protein
MVLRTRIGLIGGCRSSRLNIKVLIGSRSMKVGMAWIPRGKEKANEELRLDVSAHSQLIYLIETRG